MTQKLSEKALAHKKQVTAKYRKDNYKRITLELQHKKYNELKERSQELGETVNGFIKKAIDSRLNDTNN